MHPHRRRDDRTDGERYHHPHEHPHRPPHGGRPHHPRGGPFGGPFGGGPFGGGPFEGPPPGPPGFEGGPRHRRGGRGRAPRGDVRAAVLLLLSEEPMHGYQLMQAIADRSSGRWTPSPGAIYPTISQLEDEGLVTVTAEAGRKLVTLTDAGREHVASRRESWPDPFGSSDGAPGVDLRGLFEQLQGAVRQVARTGTEAQLTAAASILGEARRALYLLLADGPEQPPSES
jgi:DNA-binding PadR family transcriptional regulator